MPASPWISLCSPTRRNVPLSLSKDNRKKDEWSGFADLLANLIEKYAAVLDIENLPEPPICLDSEKKEIVNNSKLFVESIEKEDIA